MTTTSPLAATSPALVKVDFRELPGRARLSAVINLGGDAPARPVVLGAERLRQLSSVLDEIEGADIEAVVLTGSQHSFGAGADLNLLADAGNPDEAMRVGLRGWEIFGRLAALPVPSFALINGFALGGGLELALFADYRIAQSDTRGIALPEVRLGLLPGWGGLYHVARLAGPATAIEIALWDAMAGRQLPADDALSRRIVDAVVPSDRWDDGWPAWVAARIDAGHRALPPVAPDADWDSALAAARARLASMNVGLSDAALEALTVLEATRDLPRTEAVAPTAEAFARLLTSDAGQASLYADRVLRRPPASIDDTASPREIRRAAVIGAGLMAAQLATLLVRHAQVPVVLIDVDEARAAAGVARVHERLEKERAAGRLGDVDAARLAALVSGSASLEAIRGADFVIEAIFEDLAAKKDAFARAEEWIDPEAVLATNTSSLPVTEIARDLRFPHRVVGFHVFNPVSVVPLVEIIPASAPVGTDAATLATALALAQQLKRRAVISADRPGFIVNRLLTRLIDVVMRAVDAGADPLTVDHALDPIGLPMTPFELIDFVGLTVQLHVSETMHSAYPERFALPAWLGRVVESAAPRTRLRLREGDALAPAAAALLPPAASAPTDPAAILDAVLEALADEVELMLDEGVAADVRDIDASLLLGANYPRAAGGITPLLDSSGASERATGRRFNP